jgi:hypothetical protein
VSTGDGSRSAPGSVLAIGLAAEDSIGEAIERSVAG